MSESDKARRCVDKAVQELHEINVVLQNQNDYLRNTLKARESGIEFYKQQAEFWAGECIAEQRKASVSIVVMIMSWVLSVAAIGMNMLMCQ